MNYFKRLRDVAIAIVLLILPFFFLSAHLKHPSRVGPVDRAVLNVSEPVRWFAREAADAASGAIEEYTYLVDVGRDNDQLRRENARLRDEERRLRGEATENRRIRELLGLRPRLEGDTVAAEVIASDISNVFRVSTVYLDRGPRQLIQAGMPVVAADGLVGYVRRVHGNYSDVMLVADPQCKVDVVVRRTGARGMLGGVAETNRYLANIQFLERDDDVRVGDEVYTSGLGHRFPAGILVGHVTRVTRRDYGLYQQAEVTPSVDFSDLREVLVLTTTSRVPTDLRAGRGQE
jgi:rod shape-determining protein MreC